MQYCSLQHWTLLLSPVTSTAGYSFCFGSIPSFFLELFLHWYPVAYWAPTDLGSFSQCVQLFATPWNAGHQASLSITNSRTLPKLMFIESMMPSNHLLCHPLFLLPSIFPSIRVFSHETALHQVAKLLEFQLQHQSFQRIFGTDVLSDWLVRSPCSPMDSKSLLQHHSSKASILQPWRKQFFRFSLLYSPALTSYLTTGKTIALTTWIFVGKVMSLLVNTLSRFVIAFLPRSKHLLIS